MYGWGTQIKGQIIVKGGDNHKNAKSGWGSFKDLITTWQGKLIFK
jgi:hypothetical protein